MLRFWQLIQLTEVPVNVKAAREPANSFVVVEPSVQARARLSLCQAAPL